MGLAGTPARDPGSTFWVSPVSTFPHRVDGGNRGNRGNWSNRSNRGNRGNWSNWSNRRGGNRGDGWNRGDGIRRTDRVGGRYALGKGGGNRGNARGGIGRSDERIRLFALENRELGHVPPEWSRFLRFRRVRSRRRILEFQKTG